MAVQVSWLPHRWWLKRLTHAAYVFAADSVESNAIEQFKQVIAALPADSVFYDVGANVGRYTWLAGSLRRDIHIHAIEPDKTNYELLCKTKAECNHPRLAVHNFAASDRDGFSLFSHDPITGATGTLDDGETFTQRHFNAERSQSEICTKKLDSCSADFGSPTLIKVDVEGHEEEVFNGATELLERARPILLFESFQHPLSFRGMLVDMGYHLVDAGTGGDPDSSTSDYWAVPNNSPLRSLFDR